MIQLVCYFVTFLFRGVVHTTAQFGKNFIRAPTCGTNQKNLVEAFLVLSVSLIELRLRIGGDAELGLFLSRESSFCVTTSGAFADPGMMKQCLIDFARGQLCAGVICSLEDAVDGTVWSTL